MVFAWTVSTWVASGLGRTSAVLGGRQVGLIVVRADRERPLPSRTVGLVLMCALAAVWVASGLSPRMSVGGRPNASYGRGWGALPTRAREAVSARLGADESSVPVPRGAAGGRGAGGGGLD